MELGAVWEAICGWHCSFCRHLFEHLQLCRQGRSLSFPSHGLQAEEAAPESSSSTQRGAPAPSPAPAPAPPPARAMAGSKASAALLGFVVLQASHTRAARRCGDGRRAAAAPLPPAAGTRPQNHTPLPSAYQPVHAPPPPQLIFNIAIPAVTSAQLNPGGGACYLNLLNGSVCGEHRAVAGCWAPFPSHAVCRARLALTVAPLQQRCAALARARSRCPASTPRPPSPWLLLRFCLRHQRFRLPLLPAAAGRRCVHAARRQGRLPAGKRPAGLGALPHWVLHAWPAAGVEGACLGPLGRAAAARPAPPHGCPLPLPPPQPPQAIFGSLALFGAFWWMVCAITITSERARALGPPLLRVLRRPWLPLPMGLPPPAPPVALPPAVLSCHRRAAHPLAGTCPTPLLPRLPTSHPPAPQSAAARPPTPATRARPRATA